MIKERHTRHRGHALNTPSDRHAYVVGIRITPGAAYCRNPTVQQVHTDYARAGATLFADSAYRVNILPLEDVLPANRVILGEEFDDDRSSKWVTVAALPNGDYITMESGSGQDWSLLRQLTRGARLVSSCAVVATSFTGLLESLLAAGGGYWYWLEDDFKYLGDAYD